MHSEYAMNECGITRTRLIPVPNFKLIPGFDPNRPKLNPFQHYYQGSFYIPNWVQEQETRVVHALDLKMLLRGTWNGGTLVLILGRLELENGRSGGPWFEDHNIEQSSLAWHTANDDDDDDDDCNSLYAGLPCFYS